jgi:hypothetical protein
MRQIWNPFNLKILQYFHIQNFQFDTYLESAYCVQLFLEHVIQKYESGTILCPLI